MIRDSMSRAPSAAYDRGYDQIDWTTRMCQRCNGTGERDDRSWLACRNCNCNGYSVEPDPADDGLEHEAEQRFDERFLSPVVGQLRWSDHRPGMDGSVIGSVSLLREAVVALMVEFARDVRGEG